MKKIPTLFERDWEGDRSRVLPVVVPGCEWVLAGEGVATRKYDGTPALVRYGSLWKRHQVRPGKETPDGFLVEDVDQETGEVTGWVPVGDGPEDRWYREAFDRLHSDHLPLPDGTYELLGPKVQKNPEQTSEHVLLRHGAAETYPGVPRTFDGLAAWLEGRDIEGIVFHHPDGRMAKIKQRDFGLKRPTVTA